MTQDYPYIYTTAEEVVKEESSFDNEQGITYKEVKGEHSIWAARVPFVPSMMSEDFTRLGIKRITFIQQRQFRFIYDLARARENRATFELRFISSPNPMPGQPNLIDIVFFGKVFCKKSHGGQAIAERLWEKFISNFPLEDPFGYPIEPIVNPSEFMRYYQPLSFQEMNLSNLMEIRKFEDMPIRSTAAMGRVERKGDYIAHPFVPSDDFNPMGRFFVALASQPQKCYVGINIRPTRMWDQEIYNVSFMIGQFGKTATEDDDVTEEYIRTRSKIGIYVYTKMMQAREQLLTVHVYLVGERESPYGLAEALGSEMMGNADNVYPTMWTSAIPVDEKERQSALNNLKFFEQENWGYSIAPNPLARLRYLTTPEEAYGAFRLPVPPESGYMPGVLVRSEPFVAPADELELREQARANMDDIQAESHNQQKQEKVSLGHIYHRGKVTTGEFRINIRDLPRHTLIGGSTGSGKSSTIKHILSQLYLDYKIPFLVLYPLDKPDYRELMGFKEISKDLLVFTLGDARTSPFQFNPFEVPKGILLKTHLSKLMRAFMAAFSLQDPLPMIYREALRRIYREKGWNLLTDVGDPNRKYPIMTDFFASIQAITESLQYGKEVKDNVRQASVIRIADLLENAGHVLNVEKSMDMSVILNHPTIMEIGRVGSTQDTTLLMGFLLMRFAEEIERNPRPVNHPHITVVEEAHRLMAESRSVSGSGDFTNTAGEDFSNILAEVRGYGEGIIIAEQIPALLVKGAVGNTYVKIMHWLEDTQSFNEFGSIMNLSDKQKEYARTLTPGFAIVRSPFGKPVHIKVPEFGDQANYNKEIGAEISDAEISVMMEQKRKQLSLHVISPTGIDTSLFSGMREEPEPQKSNDTKKTNWFLSIPLQTCVYCEPLIQTGKCKYIQRVNNRLLKDQALLKNSYSIIEKVELDSSASVENSILAIVALVKEKLTGLSNEETFEVSYCFLAFISDRILHEQRDETSKNIRENCRRLLYNFAKVKRKGLS